jgi:hypothetical protein
MAGPSARIAEKGPAAQSSRLLHSNWQLSSNAAASSTSQSHFKQFGIADARPFIAYCIYTSHDEAEAFCNEAKRHSGWSNTSIKIKSDHSGAIAT